MFDNAKDKLYIHAIILFIFATIGNIVLLVKFLTAGAFFVGLLSCALIEYTLYISTLVLCAIAEKNKIVLQTTKSNNKNLNTKWNCKKCGHLNDSTSTFCENCGEYR